MILLQADNLTKSYGNRLLFADVSLGLNEGDKVGVVAKNGTGKSTLMRILAGAESCDSGKITLRNNTRIVLLQQNPLFPDNDTPQQWGERINAGYSDRMMLFVQYASQLGLEDYLNLPISLLSGGQRKRIAIAGALSQEPDILLLDEPTNHLDITAIEWLEEFLRRSRTTLMMVTHDRYFLDRVCTSILELHSREAFMHPGNYDKYLERKEARIEAARNQLDRVRNTLRREQDWMNRQPQARGGKAKGRIDRFYELKQQSTIDPDGGEADNVRLTTGNTYIGNKIFEAHKVNKSFGEKVILQDFSYIFARRDKAGIIGENGVGKTTFLKMLQGLIPTDSGYFDTGETVRFGYYSQEGLEFNPDAKVIDVVTDIAETVAMPDENRISAMAFLQHFLFEPKRQQDYVRTLSGGELCRLHLATVLMRNPNFLILDEPTNNLDLPTLEILRNYLANFNGCLLVVSHDRHFLDSTVSHLLVMEGEGAVRDFPGTYTEYRQYLRQKQETTATAKNLQQKSGNQGNSTTDAHTKQRTERPAKLTYKERKEYEALEAEIEEINARLTEIEGQFNNPGPDTDINALSREYTELKDILDQKELRWLELSEKA